MRSKSMMERRNGKKKQIIRRKKISLVMQFTGILCCIIAAFSVWMAAESADMEALTGVATNEYLVPIIVAIVCGIIGAVLIMFPKKVFRMSMF